MDFGGVQLTLPHDRIHQIPQSNYRPLAQILHEQRAPQNFRDMIRHSPPVPQSQPYGLYCHWTWYSMKPGALPAESASECLILQTPGHSLECSIWRIVAEFVTKSCPWASSLA